MAKFELYTFMRFGSANVLGRAVVMRYINLAPTAPLIMERQPDNRIDPSAVLLKDITGLPVGYVCREDSPRVAGMMDAGVALLARVASPILKGGRRDVIIWEEGMEEEERSLVGYQDRAKEFTP
jgi:hypothetical protein